MRYFMIIFFLDENNLNAKRKEKIYIIREIFFDESGYTPYMVNSQKKFTNLQRVKMY